MREAVASLPAQLRWAAEQDRPELATAREVLVVGMGGSGISGDLVAVMSERRGGRVSVHKGYGLPGWVETVRPLVLAVSYSGNTDETLDAVGSARDRGLPVAAVTTGGVLGTMAADGRFPVIFVPGGLQPRAALGYMFGSVARCVAAAGLIDDPRADLEEAATVFDELAGPGGAAEALAADLAQGLDGRIVNILGATGLAGTVARRWKTQINENAKWPAWSSVLPEADHNEIVGWAGLSDVTSRRVGVVVLRDRDEGPAIGPRVRLTRELTRGDVAWVGEVHSRGEGLPARMLSLGAVGDLLSLELARLAGVDPTPVTVIEDLKRRQREETSHGS